MVAHIWIFFSTNRSIWNIRVSTNSSQSKNMHRLQDFAASCAYRVIKSSRSHPRGALFRSNFPLTDQLHILSFGNPANARDEDRTEAISRSTENPSRRISIALGPSWINEHLNYIWTWRLMNEATDADRGVISRESWWTTSSTSIIDPRRGPFESSKAVPK